MYIFICAYLHQKIIWNYQHFFAVGKKYLDRGGGSDTEDQSQV